MSRKRMTVFAVSATLVLLAAICVSLFLSSRIDGEPIDLPTTVSPTRGGSSEAEATTAAPTTKALIRVDVDRGNVHKILSELRRPDAYSYDVASTMISSKNEKTTLHHVYVRDGYTKVVTISGDQEHHEIMGHGKSYIWLRGSAQYYVGGNATQTADSLQGIPTYESILELEPENILDASYQVLDEIDPCVYVKATLPANNYVVEYYVSLETGLLVAAKGYNADGIQIFSWKFSNISLSIPDDSAFTLPDKKLVMAVAGDN